MSRFSARFLTICLALARRMRRRRPSEQYPVRRLLVAHYLLLGDTILLAPLLAKLASSYPEAERILLARPAVVPLFEGRPWGFRALPYDPRDFSTLLPLLQSGPFDLACVLGDNRYAWLARAIGARWIVGFGDDRPAWKNWMLDVAHVFPASPASLADIMANLVPGPEPTPFRPGAWPAPLFSASALPEGCYVVLHVGASTPLKLWSPERWMALAEALLSDGLTPVWSAGPGEATYVDHIDPGRRYRRYCGTLDLAGLWQLLAGARLLVCPDTGVAHLGKVVGVPTVALFGPGSADIYGAGSFWCAAPYRAMVAPDIPCRNQNLLFRRQIDWVRRCGRSVDACLRASAGLTQDGEATSCMSAIALDQVLEACRQLAVPNPLPKSCYRSDQRSWGQSCQHDESRP